MFSISFDAGAFRDSFFDCVFQPKPARQLARPLLQGLLLQRAAPSTEHAVLWNIKTPQVGVEIKARHPKPPVCDERCIYLKIERIENYSPVIPQEKAVPPVEYGRDCMRLHRHENGLIPKAEIDARAAGGGLPQVPAVQIGW